MANAGSLYLGLISGTSADGIDAALVSFETDTPRLLGGLTHPWPEPLRRELLAVAQGETAIDLDRLGQLDVALAYGFAEAAMCLLAGLITDTRSFEFDATTARTLAAGGYLVGAGGVPERVIKPIYRMKPLPKARPCCRRCTRCCWPRPDIVASC